MARELPSTLFDARARKTLRTLFLSSYERRQMVKEAREFLASIGDYGVMSNLVTLQTSELGIRLALGARRICRRESGQRTGRPGAERLDQP